ncbi:unnamed protein product [Symbiodinium sp. CCMP2456]|nr:unnamed protein product [Symbiodinium sp. CCMP2456]
MSRARAAELRCLVPNTVQLTSVFCLWPKIALFLRRYRLTFLEVPAEVPAAENLRARSVSCPAVLSKHVKVEDETARLMYTNDLELRAQEYFQNVADRGAATSAE